MKVNIAARRVEGKVSSHLGSVEDIKLQQKEVTPTKDTQLVSADNDYNALSMVTVKPIPDEYIVPSGNQNITENGSYNIADKASVTVRVSSGGTYTPILQDKSATPTKSKQTFNADEGFDGIGKFTVQAIPSEYIVPSGTKDITSNGTHDVTDKASVKVNVPEPSGTKSITTNGTHDVKQYESAEVNVPIPEGYIIPSGSLEITEKGEYDVTTYAKAVVNVSGGDIVDYSGSQFAGSIGVPAATFTIALGVELPDKFYFYARVADNVVSLSQPYIKSFKHSANGEDIIEYYNNSAITTANGAGTMTVSSDRRSITLSNSRQFYAGTWYWTLVMEG